MSRYIIQGIGACSLTSLCFFIGETRDYSRVKVDLRCIKNRAENIREKLYDIEKNIIETFKSKK